MVGVTVPRLGTQMHLRDYMNRAAKKGLGVTYFMGVKCVMLSVVACFFPCMHVKVILLHMRAVQIVHA